MKKEELLKQLEESEKYLKERVKEKHNKSRVCYTSMLTQVQHFIEQVKELEVENAPTENADQANSGELPTSVSIPWQALVNSNHELDDLMNQAISEYLSEKYGHGVNSYSTDENLNVYSIDWDTEAKAEEEQEEPKPAVTGILVNVDNQTIDKAELPMNHTLDDIYKMLKCEVIDIVERKVGEKCFDFIVDDNGLLKPDRKVAVAVRQKKFGVCEELVGNVFICSHNDDGELLSISEQDIEYIKKHTAHLIEGADEFKVVLANI